MQRGLSVLDNMLRTQAYTAIRAAYAYYASNFELPYINFYILRILVRRLKNMIQNSYLVLATARVIPDDRELIAFYSDGGFLDIVETGEFAA